MGKLSKLADSVVDKSYTTIDEQKKIDSGYYDAGSRATTIKEPLVNAAGIATNAATTQATPKKKRGISSTRVSYKTKTPATTSIQI